MSTLFSLTISHSNPWKYTKVSQPLHLDGVLNLLNVCVRATLDNIASSVTDLLLEYGDPVME